MNLPPSPSWSSAIRFVSVLVLVAATSAGLGAAEPADAQIRSAVADIERHERQVAGQATANAATVTRTLRLLGPTRERLDSSPNRSHPSWIEADQRLRALVSRLEALAGGGGSTPAPAAGVVAPPRPAAAPAASATMISQDRVLIQKLIRDIASATDTLDQGGVKPFQAADYIATQTAIAERFKEALAAYSSFPTDADVRTATEALATFENMIAFGRNEAAKQTQSLGDVQARLRAIDQQLGRVPAPPTPPHTDDAVNAWLVTLARTREAAAQRLQELAVIRQHAHLPHQPGTVGEGAPYDMQDVGRLDAAWRDNVRVIDESLTQFSADLDLQVSHLSHTLDFLNRLDPASAQDQANAFLGAGKAAGLRQRLAEAQQLVAVAVNYDRQLGREQLAAHTAMQQTVERAAADFATKLARARELVRVPQAASTDRGLIAIARQTLQHPDYEVGSIRRLVINADKVHREMKTSETEFDKVNVGAGGRVTLSGTETTYTYAWDQFQVATVEPVGERFFIYFNTLKHFTSGGPTTPLNRWILAERIQGSEIPEANIDRD